MFVIIFRILTLDLYLFTFIIPRPEDDPLRVSKHVA
jgi:hypothetical protein